MVGLPKHFDNFYASPTPEPEAVDQEPKIKLEDTQEEVRGEYCDDRNGEGEESGDGSTTQQGSPEIDIKVFLQTDAGETFEITPEPELRVCPEYDDPKADVQVISSDGVMFRMHSYVLNFASARFREELRNHDPTSGTILTFELEDEIYEDAETLKDFFDVLSDKNQSIQDIISRPFDTSSNFSQPLKLIRLLRKYDCPTRLEALQLHVRLRQWSRLPTDTISAYGLFKFSVYLDDPLGAKEAISELRDEIWIEADGEVEDGETIPPLKRCIGGGSVLDVSSMSQDEIGSYPIRYLTALVRSTRSIWRRKRKGEEEDAAWRAAENEFYQILTHD